MADHDGEVRWYTADRGGSFPLETFHVPRTLDKALAKIAGRGGLRNPHQPRFLNHDARLPRRTRRRFLDQPGADRRLRPFARVGIWPTASKPGKQGKLAGGLYGRWEWAGRFFGERCFTAFRDASKVACPSGRAPAARRRLCTADTQAATPHLQKFGCIEIPAEDYLARLRRALRRRCEFIGNNNP